MPPSSTTSSRAPASEFDSLAELREDIERRLREQLEDAVESEFRAAASASSSSLEVRGLARARRQRATTLLRELLQSLERRGIDLETYLALTEPDAEQLEERIVARGGRLDRRASSCSRRSRTSSDLRSPTKRFPRRCASRAKRRRRSKGSVGSDGR